MNKRTMNDAAEPTPALIDGAVMATYVAAQLLLVDRMVDNILRGK